MTRMNAARLARFLVLALCASLAACASTQKHSRDLLRISLYDYAGAIRWNDFAGAASNFVDPEVLAKRPMRNVDVQRYEQVQVTGYTVRGTEQVSPESYRQVVEIRLVNRHTQTERVVMDAQHWRYDAEQKRWWLTSGLPDITDAH